jgi:uncharacterized protein YbjQ (UPF0145 family)
MLVARSALFALSAVLLLGCGHSERQVSPAFATHDRPSAPLSGDQSMWVTSGDIETPHRQLAIVRTHTYRREVLETEGVAELRAEAMKVGADAVIAVQFHPELTEEMAYRPGTLFRLGTRWVTVYSLSGIAVAFEGQRPATPPPGLRLNLPPE